MICFWMAGKIVRMRIFEDDNGVMNRSVCDVSGGNSCCVSIYALRQHQKVIDLLGAVQQPGIYQKPLFERFVNILESEFGKLLRQAFFGADMEIL